MDAYLSLADGSRVAVRDGLTIGRVAGCDVVVRDTKASRRHARLCVEGSVVEIEDLDSSNGTRLNGRPVQRRVLRDGDEVQIGTTVLVFREGAGAAAEQTPPAPAAAPESATESALPSADPPPPPSPAPPSPAPPPPSDDDVDLFGEDPFDGAPDEDLPAPPTGAIRVPLPPPRPPAPRSEPPPPAAGQVDGGVIEFVDEVVEVRRPAPPPARGGPAAPPRPVAHGGGPGAAAEPEVRQQQRVLQFGANRKAAGPLGDDLAQLGGTARALIFAAVLAGAVGLGWLVMTLVR